MVHLIALLRLETGVYGTFLARMILSLFFYGVFVDVFFYFVRILNLKSLSF